jgi:hypothetical protein
MPTFHSPFYLLKFTPKCTPKKNNFSLNFELKNPSIGLKNGFNKKRDLTNLTEKIRGIFSVGNQRNTLGFVGIIFQGPTLDKLRFFLPILFGEE